MNTWGDTDRVTDQVKRRQAFQRQHPDVHIEHRTEPRWHWWAGWIDDGQRQERTAPELRYLLDDLEAAFGR